MFKPPSSSLSMCTIFRSSPIDDRKMNSLTSKTQNRSIPKQNFKKIEFNSFRLPNNFQSLTPPLKHSHFLRKVLVVVPLNLCNELFLIRRSSEETTIFPKPNRCSTRIHFFALIHMVLIECNINLFAYSPNAKTKCLE